MAKRQGLWVLQQFPMTEDVGMFYRHVLRGMV